MGVAPVRLGKLNLPASSSHLHSPSPNNLPLPFRFPLVDSLRNPSLPTGDQQRGTSPFTQPSDPIFLRLSSSRTPPPITATSVHPSSLTSARGTPLPKPTHKNQNTYLDKIPNYACDLYT